MEARFPKNSQIHAIFFLIQPDFWGRISLLLLVRVEMIDFWKDSF
jgi:hypothetical protein